MSLSVKFLVPQADGLGSRGRRSDGQGFSDVHRQRHLPVCEREGKSKRERTRESHRERHRGGERDREGESGVGVMDKAFPVSVGNVIL